ncbi:hypothetical protein M0813_11172 [Anaeramoeba flamelloides]|uniref:Uncharacterized protein n=1 Tax=Anaeramoeba flamelloides TaxID=1746091 RepID=A0AAV8AEG2_9EUKA|nr:hypothetical protein M0812_05153 [Anaeramoeba flamelloides]KAJ6255612.1 hypothetical protein M0813_11172 [Anaeramoeba flamelloides]
MSYLFRPLLFSEMGHRSQKLLNSYSKKHLINAKFKIVEQENFFINSSIKYTSNQVFQASNIYAKITGEYLFHDLFAIRANFSPPKQAILKLFVPKFNTKFQNLGVVAQSDPKKIIGYASFRHKFMTSSLTADLFSKRYTFSGTLSKKESGVGLFCSGHLKPFNLDDLEFVGQYTFTDPTKKRKLVLSPRYEHIKKTFSITAFAHLFPQLSLAFSLTKNFNKQAMNDQNNNTRFAIAAHTESKFKKEIQLYAKIDSQAKVAISAQIPKIKKNLSLSFSISSKLNQLKSTNFFIGIDFGTFFLNK